MYVHKAKCFNIADMKFNKLTVKNLNKIKYRVLLCDKFKTQTKFQVLIQIV